MYLTLKKKKFLYLLNDPCIYDKFFLSWKDSPYLLNDPHKKIKINSKVCFFTTSIIVPKEKSKSFYLKMTYCCLIPVWNQGRWTNNVNNAIVFRMCMCTFYSHTHRHNNQSVYYIAVVTWIFVGVWSCFLHILTLFVMGNIVKRMKCNSN